MIKNMKITKSEIKNACNEIARECANVWVEDTAGGKHKNVWLESVTDSKGVTTIRVGHMTFGKKDGGNSKRKNTRIAYDAMCKKISETFPGGNWWYANEYSFLNEN